MGILNRPSNGQAAALILIWKALAARPTSIPKAELLGRLEPRPLSDATNPAVRRTLARWKELGLFIENDDGTVELCEPFRDPGLQSDQESDYGGFRAGVRKLILGQKNNKEFGLPEPSGCADFTLLLAWLLATDVFADHCKSHKRAAAFESTQLTPDAQGGTVISNSTRWDGFIDWATFCEFGFSPGSGIVLEPSRVIKGELASMFEKEQKMPIKRFVKELADRVPVFDGGHYARKARARATEAWTPLGGGALSPALSLGLLTLEEGGFVSLDDLADAEARQLTGRGMTTLREVTHVSVEKTE